MQGGTAIPHSQNIQSRYRKRRVRKTGRASRSLDAFNRQKFFSSLMKGRWLHKSQYTDALMHLERTRSDACLLQGNKWEAPFFGGNSEHPSRNTQNKLFSSENSAGVHARARATKIKVTGLEMAQKVRLGRKLFFFLCFGLDPNGVSQTLVFPEGIKGRGGNLKKVGIYPSVAWQCAVYFSRFSSPT